VIKIEITLEEVKEALRIDYEDEDYFLNLCIRTAEGYLRDAIEGYDVKIKEQSFANKAKLVIIMITQDLFDNRGYSTDKQSEKVKYILQSFMAQMRWT